MNKPSSKPRPTALQAFPTVVATPGELRPRESGLKPSTPRRGGKR